MVLVFSSAVTPVDEVDVAVDGSTGWMISSSEISEVDRDDIFDVDGSALRRGEISESEGREDLIFELDSREVWWLKNIVE